MSPTGPGFRRRARRTGAAVLFDEAVALVQADPIRWLARAAGPALPLALLSLVFIRVHRTDWVGDAWGDVLPRSVAAAAALVAAYLLRGVGHGRAARQVVRALHPQALRGEGAARTADLVGAASLGGGTTLLLSTLTLPGLLAAGYFAAVPALIAVEDRDLPSALRAAARLPRGTAGKGALVALMAGALSLLVWGNVLLGGVAGVWLLRALTGADVALLGQLLSPANGGFLAAAAVLALLVVEPFWVIARSLVFLDAHLGRSGADLQEQWAQLRGAQAARGSGPRAPGPWWSAAGLLLLGLPAISVPALAEVDGVELPVRPLEAYADEVGLARELLEARIADYATSGWEDLTETAPGLRRALEGPVELPDGRVLPLDPAPLLADLPEWIHSDGTLADARRTLFRLEQAEREARAVLEPVSDPAGDDPRALLEAEFARGDYGEAPGRAAGDAYRETLRERIGSFFRRLADWLREGESAPGPRTAPAVDLSGLRWLVIGAAVAVLLLLLFVFFRQYVELNRVHARGQGTDGASAGALPDARRRSPAGWREQAERLAAEGRRREAARALYLAVLSALDRSREIDYRPDRTNGALLAGFRGPEVRRRRFGEATLGYERAWYGEIEPDEGRLSEMLRLCDGLVAGARPELGP